MMEVVTSAGAIRCARYQSNCHHQQTITQLFASQMPVLPPNQQSQRTEGKVLCNVYKERKYKSVLVAYVYDGCCIYRAGSVN